MGYRVEAQVRADGGAWLPYSATVRLAAVPPSTAAAGEQVVRDVAEALGVSPMAIEVKNVSVTRIERRSARERRSAWR